MTINANALEYRKMVSDLVYQTLSSAGEICRLRCFSREESGDPDLLDSIADGIYRFLSDGDVFDQVMRTLLDRDPDYIGNLIGEGSEDTAKAIIGKVLGEHPSNVE